MNSGQENFSTLQKSHMLSTRKAAKILKCAPDYVSKLCREGKLEGTRVGNAWFVSRSSLDLFQANRKSLKEQRSFSLAQQRRQETRDYRQQKGIPLTPKRILGIIPSTLISLGIAGILLLGVFQSAAALRGTFLQHYFPASVASVPSFNSPFFGGPLAVIIPSSNSTGERITIPTLSDVFSRTGGFFSNLFASLFTPTHLAVNSLPPSAPQPSVPPPTPFLPPASSKGGTTIIEQKTYPVIEHTIEHTIEQVIPQGGGVTQDVLTQQLQELGNALRQEIYANAGSTPGTTYSSGGFTNSIALASDINHLSNVTLSNITVNGVNGLTPSDIPTSTLIPSSPLTGSFAVVGSGGSIGCQTASSTQAGCLSSADWNTFNGKDSFGYPFTTATDFGQTVVATTSNSLPIYFENGLYASTTLIADNATTTSATTTNLDIASNLFLGSNGELNSFTGTGLAISGGNLNIASTTVSAGSYTNANVTVNAQGQLTSASSGFSYPFTTQTNFGTTTQATTTPLWFQEGLYASSTSQFANSTTTLATIGTLFMDGSAFSNLLGTGLSDVAGALTNSGVLSVTLPGSTLTGALTLATSSAAFNGLTSSTTITNSGGTLTFLDTLAGLLAVGGGGTGQTSFTSNGVLYGNGSGALQATGGGGANSVLVANNGAPSFSSAITVGTSVTTPVVNATTALQLGGANINTAGTLSNVAYLNQAQSFTGLNQFEAGASTTQFSSYGSSYFGATATSSFASNGALTLSQALAPGSGGTGISNPSAAGVLLGSYGGGSYQQLATSSLGLPTVIGPTGQTTSGPTVTFATTTSTQNGLTSALTITGSGSTITFEPSLLGTLAVGGGGTGQTSFTSGQLLYGSGTGALSSVGTTTLSASSPLTGSFTVVGSGGSIGCQTASGSQAGCLSSTDWTTFNNKQAPISASWPVTLSGTTVGFAGLSTTTNLTVGDVPYVTGANTFGQVSTSTPSIGSVLTYSGTLGNLLGGSSGTFSIANSAVTNAMLANSSVTVNGVSISLGGSGTVASTTLLGDNNTFGGVDLFTNASSNFGGTWQTFSPSHFDTFVYPFIGSATSSVITFSGGISTPELTNLTSNGLTYTAGGNGTLNTVATSSVSAGTGVTFSGTPGALVGGTALTINTPWTISGSNIYNNNGGNVGIGTTSPYALLSVGNTGGIGFTTATSTFNTTGGINLASGGCFAIAGACLSASGGGGGITAIGPTGQTTSGPTVTFATTTSTQNGLTSALTITGSGSTITFEPSLLGTLAVGGGGTGQTSFTSGQLLYGSGTGALSSVGTTTLSASSPLTGSFTVVGSGGSIGCQTASGSQAGCLSSTDWTTFNNKQAPISASWPVTLSGTTVGFAGLSTTTNLTVGDVPYVTGANTFGQVSTSTPSIGSVLTYSGTLGNLLGGSSGTFSIANSAVTNAMLANSTISGIALGSNLANLSATNGTLTFSGSYNGSAAQTVGLNLGNANTWTALQQFNGQASTTQLTTTGSTYLATAGGNVGIGTTSPFTKLDVNGAIVSSSAAANNYVGLNINPLGYGLPYTVSGLWYDTTANVLHLDSLSGGVAYRNIDVGTQGGNLGLGTTTPLSKLAVSGGASIGADYNTAAPTNGLIVEGNVGIGTTSPFTTLSVQGNGYLSGNLTAANITATGTLAVSGTATVGNLINSGVTANTLLYSNGSSQDASVSLPAYVTLSSGSLAISGLPVADLAANTISGITLGNNLNTLTFGTHLTSGGSSYNGSSATTISTDATNLNTASTIVARDASGNFSAGTITANLTGTASNVTTDANLTGPITSSGNATAVASQTGTGSTFVMSASPTLTGSIGFPSGIWNSSGNVGIGTTNPAARLDVVTGGGGHLYTSDYGCGAYGGIGGNATLTGCTNYALLTNGTDTFINRPSGDVIQFRESNSPEMTVAAGGYVGIGTAGPSTGLEVSGANDNAAFITSQNTAMAGSPILQIGMNSGNNAALFSATAGTDMKFWNGQYALTILGSNGNVGINNRGPAYALDVSGFINTDQYSGYKQAGNTVLYASTTNNSLAVGENAASWANATSTTFYDTAVGQNALNTAPTNALSTDNTAVGYSALTVNSSGTANTAEGYKSLYYNTTGSYNTAVGLDSLLGNSAGAYNTALGFLSEYNTTGSYNTGLGADTLYSNTSGSFNVAAGLNSLYYNTSATGTVAIGYAASRGTGNYYSQGGTYLGYQSGYNVATSSDYNTYLGYQSGYNTLSGYDNLLLGVQPNISGTGYITTGGNNIGIGYNTLFPSATASNQLNVGNFIFGTLPATTSNSSLTVGSGELGLGTSTPQSVLAVSGGQSIGADYNMAAPTNGLIVEGEVGIGTTSPATTLSVAGNGYLTGGLGVGVVDTTAGEVKASAYHFPTGSGYLDSDGAGVQVQGSYLFANGGQTNDFYSQTNAVFRGGISNDSAAYLTVSGGTSGYTYFSGNVGIGTTSPTQKLDVYGGTNSTGGILVQGGGDNGTFTSIELSHTDVRGSYTTPWNDYLVHNGSNYTSIPSANGGLNGSLQLYASQNMAMQFGTNNSAVVTLTGTGSVGIGITSPVTKLDVVGAGTGLPATSGTAESAGLITRLHDSTNLVLDTGGDGGTGAWVQATDQTNLATDYPLLLNPNGGNVQIGSATGDVHIGGPGVSPNLVFDNNATIKGLSGQTITLGAGSDIFNVAVKLGIGSSTPWRALSVNGTTALVGLTNSAGGSALCISSAGDILNSGGTSCTGSSIQYKENVQTLTPGFALNEINQLRVVSFDYKPGDYSPWNSPHSYGMIAEQVQQVDPNLVSFDSNGQPFSLQFEKITGLEAQAIQELDANLQAIASTTASSTPEAQTFAQGFWSSVETNVANWLASATNGIGNLFAQTIHAQNVYADTVTANTLCLGSVCITQSQLQALLSGTSASASTSPTTGTHILPVVTLNGNNPALISVGDSYVDLGATVTDSAEPNLGYSVSVDGGATTTESQVSITTSSPGTHTILYMATDSHGNVGTATRSVIVQALGSTGTTTTPTVTSTASSTPTTTPTVTSTASSTPTSTTQSVITTQTASSTPASSTATSSPITIATTTSTASSTATSTTP